MRTIKETIKKEKRIKKLYFDNLEKYTEYKINVKQYLRNAHRIKKMYNNIIKIKV